MSDSDSDYSDAISKKKKKLKTKIKPTKKKAASKPTKKKAPPKPTKKAAKKIKVITTKVQYSDSEAESESDTESQKNRVYDSEEYFTESEHEEEKAPEPTEEEAPAAGGFELPTDPAIMVFVGSCAAGKSYMLRYCMYLWSQMHHFGFGLCFCPTSFNGDLSFLPKRAVKEEYNEEYLEAYIKNLRQKTEEGKEKNGRDWQLKPNFVIFDDCLSLLVGSKFFNNWVSTFRHTNTSILILTQYMAASRSVSTLLRNCTNYAFMWPQSLENSLEAMHSAYGQMFKRIDKSDKSSYDQFCEALDKCRQRKYSCLVYKNSPDIINKEQAYTRIKASEFPQNFKMVF